MVLDTLGHVLNTSELATNGCAPWHTHPPGSLRRRCSEISALQSLPESPYQLTCALPACPAGPGGPAAPCRQQHRSRPRLLTSHAGCWLVAAGRAWRHPPATKPCFIHCRKISTRCAAACARMVACLPLSISFLPPHWRRLPTLTTCHPPRHLPPHAHLAGVPADSGRSSDGASRVAALHDRQASLPPVHHPGRNSKRVLHSASGERLLAAPAPQGSSSSREIWDLLALKQAACAWV